MTASQTINIPSLNSVWEKKLFPTYIKVYFEDAPVIFHGDRNASTVYPRS